MRRAASKFRFPLLITPAREGVNLVKGVTPMTTVKDVQRAQVLIERCMLTYMPFEEVQTKLHHESDVEPALTQIVWRKLQEANPRFFEHYLLRVRLKEQLVAFASLLAPSDGLAVNPLQTPRDEAP